MKRVLLFSCLLLSLFLATPALAQKGCEFEIAGTWKTIVAGETSPLTYRFEPDGKVLVLTQGKTEASSATFALDDPKAPKRISFTTTEGIGVIETGSSSFDISTFDDTSFTSIGKGSPPISWVRLDSTRYFLVLAGRSGTFYDGSGPTFPMLIKKDGNKSEINAVGIYSLNGNRVFGEIPAETYNQFMKESGKPSEIILRLELSPPQYARTLKVVATWQRRARNNELLYPDPYLDNVLLAKQITESLNQCRETVMLYRLDWGVKDYISENYGRARAPFYFFKEMRRLNASLHVSDEEFYSDKPDLIRRPGK